MAGYGVGGAAASGLQAGFDMGLRADDAAERRRIATVAENRQAMLDTERQAQIARHNERQDKADAWAEEDRALAAWGQEREALALEGAGLAAQYGGMDKIPGDVGSNYARRANETNMRGTMLLAKRQAPVVEKELQWAKDTASRIQAGQQRLEDLTPTETVRLLQAIRKAPVGDLLRPKEGGNSKVGQARDDVVAGIETQNQGLLLQGAGTLLDPDLQEGVGHTAADGSEIVRKELYGLVPAMPGPGGLRAPGAAPQSLAATLNAVLNPNPAPQGQAQEPPPKLMPVLRVTARHPDGTEVSYHAPVTKGRGTGAGDAVHPGFDLSAAMDRLGQLGALEAWANTPAARAKIEAGLKELGADSNSFLGAYYAMKGNPNALLPPGENDPVSKKIAAVQKLAKEQFDGDFKKAMLAYEGRTELGPLAKKLADIEASGLSPEDKATATRVAAMGAKGAGVGGDGKGGDGSIGVTHRVGKLTPEQNDALFGPQGAVTEGRLDPNRINSRTASILADAELTSPGTDFAKMSGDIALGRNPTFRTRAIVAETLPSVMKNMTEAGKKLEFSDVRALGRMQAWIKGQLNDPQWTYYMVHRNDALMTIANVMRGIGMSDQAHRAEMEVTDPAMSPAALDAWLASQMAALEPRLKLNRQITEGGSAAKPRSSGAAPAAAAPKRITNDAEYEALPKGAKFIAPDGSTRQKP